MSALRTFVLLAFGTAGVAAAVEWFGLWPWLMVPGMVLVVACEVWNRDTSQPDATYASVTETEQSAPTGQSDLQ